MRRSPLRKQQANAAPIDIGAHGTNTRPYEPLTPAQVARLITEAIALMGDVGIRFEPGSEADQLLAAAGCSVAADGVIRFPAALVRAALASCAKGTRIWNRAGDTGITIDTEHTWFMPGMTCIRIIDPVSGKTRDSTPRRSCADHPHCRWPAQYRCSLRGLQGYPQLHPGGRDRRICLPDRKHHANRWSICANSPPRSKR